MPRQIFIVDAYIVDANGTFNYINANYPKKFDSNSYNGDIDKTKKRAEGDMAECWGAMCKVDTRQVQTVCLHTVDGFVLETRTMGQLVSPEPEPEPEPTPEPEPEPEGN